MVVRIDSWETSSLYPNGHTVRVLGRAGELDTEVQTIVVENSISVPPFSDAQVNATFIHTYIYVISTSLILWDF